MIYFSKLIDICINLYESQKLEPIINLYQPLADWFERNQKVMASLGLIHGWCSNNFSAMTSLDLQALAIMADVGLKWLSIKKANISPEEKAINAAVSIASVYN